MHLLTLLCCKHVQDLYLMLEWMPAEHRLINSQVGRYMWKWYRRLHPDQQEADYVYV